MNYTRYDNNGKVYIHIDKDEEDKVLARWHEKAHVKYTSRDLKDRVVHIIVNRMLMKGKKWMEINPEFMSDMSMYYWGSFNVMEDERIESLAKKSPTISTRLWDWKWKIGTTKNMAIAHSNPVESLLAIRFLRSRYFYYDDKMSKLGKAADKAVYNSRKSGLNISMFLAGYEEYCDNVIDPVCWKEGKKASSNYNWKRIAKRLNNPWGINNDEKM